MTHERPALSAQRQAVSPQLLEPRERVLRASVRIGEHEREPVPHMNVAGEGSESGPMTYRFPTVDRDHALVRQL